MAQPITPLEHAGTGRPIAVVYGPAGAWAPIWSDLTALTQVYRYDRARSTPHSLVASV